MKVDVAPNVKTLIDKDYFASYLNMARHNAYVVLAHITKLLGEKFSISEEGSLSEMRAITILIDAKNPVLAKRSADLLVKHFPFLLPMTNKLQEIEKRKAEQYSYNDYYTILRDVLGYLNDFRNSFTHTMHGSVIMHRKMASMLEETFDSGLRTVIDRFKLDEKGVGHLRRYKGKMMPNPSFYYNFFDEQGAITDKGVAFLCCLFLEKNYATLFLKRIRHFKAGDTPAARATLECYSVFRTQIPQERIQSTDKGLSLGLDMLNELKRCPKPLFDLLKPSDAATFRVKIDDADRSELAEESDDLFLLLRSSNRFAFHAFRYIDHFNLLGDYRFHIDMGKYFHTFYPKHTVDGETHQRVLSKELKCFGVPDYLNEQRLSQWSDLIKDHPGSDCGQPYVADTYPHYHSLNNQIGIKQVSGNGTLPTLNGKDTHNELPDFWLSNLELPGLIFYAWLRRNEKHNPAVVVIHQHREKVVRLFSDIKHGALRSLGANAASEVLSRYGLNISDLPENIQLFLKGIAPAPNDNFVAYAERKVKKELEDCNMRLRRLETQLRSIGQKGNKFGKKQFVEIKAGILADYLAADMLWLQPANGDKVTSLNYQVLQARLAFFGRDKQLLGQIFRECKLVESENQHPFLHKLNPDSYFSISAFYKAYIEARKAYFTKCMEEKQYHRYSFLKADAAKWNPDNNAAMLAEKYLSMPMNLPRGLFLDAIKDWLRHNGSDAMRQLIAQSERVNTIFLIQKYFELELNDGSQPFYSFARSYKFIDRLNDARQKQFSRLERNYYTVAQLSAMMPALKSEIAKLPEKGQMANGRNGNQMGISKTTRTAMLAEYSNFTQNEKLIRLYKAEDMLLLLMAKEILIHQPTTSIDFAMDSAALKLSAISPQNPEPLSMQVACSVAVHGKRIVHQGLKVKNYGDFMRFARDRRMAGLFAFVGESEIAYPSLIAELDGYDRIRLDVFSALHRFEHAVAKRYPHELNRAIADENVKTRKQKHYASFNAVQQVFYDKYPRLESERERVRKIRNAFAHNQYPDPNFCPTANGCMPAIARSIGQHICSLLDEYTNKLIH